MFDIFKLKNQMSNIVTHLKDGYAGLRGDRAVPELLKNISVSAYGEVTKLNTIASVVTLDSRTILVNSYDGSLIKDITKAIQEANLGLGICNEGNSIRVSFPYMSDEQRNVFVKKSKELAETAKISIRQLRMNANNDIKKDPSLEENRKNKYYKEIQTCTDDFVNQINTLCFDKINNINTI